jgi:hypothetical protein
MLTVSCIDSPLRAALLRKRRVLYLRGLETVSILLEFLKLQGVKMLSGKMVWEITLSLSVPLCSFETGKLSGLRW